MCDMDKKFKVSWAELKALASKKYVGFHSTETANLTEVFIIEDGKPSFWTWIYKAADPNYDAEVRADWENNYEADANGPTKPRDYDGRDKVQPVTASRGQWHVWHGAGDSATDVGAGAVFEASRSTEGTSEIEWSYRDPVWIAGGTLQCQGASLGDYVNFQIVAPATPVTPSETGNCHLVFGVLVPADGDGAWQVDIDEAVLVPTASGTGGYWDWQQPTDMKGKGSIAKSAPGEGAYHLVPAEVVLVHFVRNARLLTGDRFFDPQNPNPSAILPFWKLRCRVTKAASGGTLDVVWTVLVTRGWTT